MVVCTGISVYRHLGIFDLDIGIDLSFFVRSDFVWVEAVLIIFTIPYKDKVEGEAV